MIPTNSYFVKVQWLSKVFDVLGTCILYIECFLVLNVHICSCKLALRRPQQLFRTQDNSCTALPIAN